MDVIAVNPNSTLQEESLKIQLAKKSRMWDGITCGMLYLLAICFHFYRLGSPSLWYDETWSVDIARQPFNIFWRIISSHDPNMTLYYILLRFWVQILDRVGIPVTEFWARFPSAFFSSIASIFIFLLAKHFFSRSLGTIITILFIVNVEILTYIQQARSYGLLIFLLSLSWYSLVILLSSLSVKKRWWVVYVFSTALAFYTQLFSIFIIIAQVMALVGLACFPNQWRLTVWQRWKPFLLSFIGVGLLIISEMRVAMSNVGKVDWLPRPKPSDLYNIFHILTGNDGSYFLLALALLSIGTVIIAVSMILNWKPTLWRLFPKDLQIRELLQKTFSQTEHLPLLWICICWLFVPLLLSYIMSLGSSRYFSLRYLMVITPAFCFLIGLGIVSLRNRGIRILLSLELLIVAVFVTKNYYPNAQIEDWRTPTQWIQSHYHAGDGIVCYNNIQGCQFATEYYFETYPQSGADYTPDTPGFWPWTSDYLSYQDAKQATDPKALAKFAAHHSHIFYIVARLSGPQSEAIATRGRAFLDHHYRFVGQYASKGVSVRLYITNL